LLLGAPNKVMREKDHIGTGRNENELADERGQVKNPSTARIRRMVGRRKPRLARGKAGPT
jgi:hypothetical protein